MGHVVRSRGGLETIIYQMGKGGDGERGGTDRQRSFFPCLVWGGHPYQLIPPFHRKEGGSGGGGPDTAIIVHTCHSPF